MIDCLDPKRSQFNYFSSGGVYRVERYVFRESLLEGKHIFRVPEARSTVIVSEEFKAAVENAGLVGLDFRVLPGMKEPAGHRAKKPAASRPDSKKPNRKAARPKRTTIKVKTPGSVVTVRRSLPPLSDTQLKAVEKSLKVKFPKAYRAFLLACNGGEPAPDGFRRPGEEEPWVYVQQFLEISDHEGINLVDSFNLFKREHDWLPKSLMPIAKDPGGNLICLSVSGTDKGAVYFWDHEQAGERELDDPSDYADVTLIAASFEEFLAGFPKRPRRKR
ncbi:MAG: SMI1/KNR4 family protein [Planctomycetota bacterium]